MMRRAAVTVQGMVQGVGFRPFVHGLATRLHLAGFVRNEPHGVEIEVEGSSSAVDAFVAQLKTSAPPLVRVQEVWVHEMRVAGDKTFEIRSSVRAGERTVLIAPDQATCEDCLRELHDPRDRRYRYPFINCTNCGPRYTIIRDVPYDRANTTMAEFEMCPRCRAEYEDPTNRRFHAEPTCCPVCGPRVELLDADGKRIACADPIEEAIHLLSLGRIVAVKGLGGFHLACDATHAAPVRLLRRRKQRDLKPFAIMVRNTQAAERICEVSDEERAALVRPERPILLMKKRSGHDIPDEVAPRSNSFGVMLPYTPIHALLMEGPFEALVMTSGNLTDEPIAFTNEEALDRLRNLADCFLTHNRAIHIRTDDSVARVIAGRQRFLRRSRGYAPFPVTLPVDTAGREILAVGPELSATLCLTRGPQAFLSHHLGDLENVAAYDAFLQAVEHLENLMAVTPRVVACDMHPDYGSTRYARSSGLPVIPVQHHHAHIASVLAEAGRTDQVIGVAFDGLGWGEDGTVWGGEFLVCDLAGYQRVGHLAVVPQPGGDVSSKRPARMGYVYLTAAYGEQAEKLAEELMPELSADERRVIAQQIERRVNCPRTSSMGRLFDAASALLGICSENTYHAQAPIELEAHAWDAGDESGVYTCNIEVEERGVCVVHASDIVRGMVDDFRSGVSRVTCAARFHNSIARATVEVCERIRDRTRLNAAALSGGVFANAYLLEHTMRLLEGESFEVLLNALVPAGDGGVCLGQAAVAAWRCKCV